MPPVSRIFSLTLPAPLTVFDVRPALDAGPPAMPSPEIEISPGPGTLTTRRASPEISLMDSLLSLNLLLGSTTAFTSSSQALVESPCTVALVMGGWTRTYPAPFRQPPAWAPTAREPDPSKPTMSPAL